MLQIADVPRGLRTLDALVKEAPVEVLAAGTVQPGHYLIVFGGQVEAVVLSFERASSTAGDLVLDSVLLADAEPRLVPAFRDGVVRPTWQGDTLGVVQSSSCPVLLAAVDAALKGAQVDLVELRVADGLGGRSLATVWGAVHDVEAAIELACSVITREEGKGRLARGAATTSIIPNADADVQRAVSLGTRFSREWRG
jgi:microcompartment protein CcmL/EutN